MPRRPKFSLYEPVLIKKVPKYLDVLKNQSGRIVKIDRDYYDNTYYYVQLDFNNRIVDRMFKAGDLISDPTAKKVTKIFDHLKTDVTSN